MIKYMFKSKGTKNQGQSTVEYLLVGSLAVAFVLVLVIQFNPRLKTMVTRMEDVVAEKLAQGKLMGHTRGGGPLAQSGAVQGFTGASGVQETPSEAPEEGGAGAGGVASRGRGSGDAAFLSVDDTVSVESRRRRTSQSSKKVTAGDDPAVVAAITAQVAGQEADVEERQAQKTDKKESGEKKSRGVIYEEGEEETVFRGGEFDWMRLLIILLIVILVAYIGFEIFKAIKASRSGR